jgi:nitrite reductase/ring-hydroxylating ferredoxin subunit
MTDRNTVTKLCHVDELDEATALRVTPPGQEAIALCLFEQQVYAIADTCSHGMASLSEGDVEDGVIYCPFHGGSFDVTTGAPLEKPCVVPVRSYPVEVRDGYVYLLQGS